MSYNNFFNKLKNFKPDEVELIKKAYNIAEESHGNQKRDSGEAFFIHPLSVAMLLINLNLDTQSVCAALLHDTVEDTSMTVKTIKKEFGEDIAYLVSGLTKLTKIKFESKTEKNAENLRKLLIATSGDIRVLIIKLADRLHNMRTIGAIQNEKRRLKIANETLMIFAPLAERIGMYQIKNELEDLAFKQTNPTESKAIREGVRRTKKTKKCVIDSILSKLKNDIKSTDDINFLIYGREKKPYSIWKKMRRKNVSFNYLFDIIAFRVLVDDIPSCYKILGIINSKYKMIPNTFKDYISTPKENGYQSLHMVIVGPQNIKIEIQIRTRKMHNIAEFGVASHWLYKQNIKDTKNLKEYKWIRELAKTFKNSGNISSTFMNTRLHVYNDEVFCFTPKGDVFSLPKGSTVIDFAYEIHSDIGNKCIGGKINGIIVQIKTELKNGDEVEIITSKNSVPSPAWLNFAKTGKAKSEVKHYLRIQKQQEYEKLGRKIIKNYFEGFALKISDKILEKNLINFQQNNVSEIYAHVGEGLITKKDFLKKIYPDFTKKIAKEEVDKKIERKIQKKIDDKGITAKRKLDNILIDGLIPGMAIKFAKCCLPIPGDEILGIINTGIGVTIHKINCSNIKHIVPSEDRIIKLNWSKTEGLPDRTYVSKIIIALKNKAGALASIINLFAERNINIAGIKTLNKNVDMQEVELDIEIQNVEHLSDVLASARALKTVYSIERS